MECREGQTPTAEGSSLVSQSSANRLECQEQCRLNALCNAVAWNIPVNECHMKEGFDVGAADVWNDVTDFDFCWEVLSGAPMHMHYWLAVHGWGKDSGPGTVNTMMLDVVG